VKLTPRQREARALLSGPQRHTLLVGGSRSGKTSLATYAILTRATCVPGSRHVILRQRANAARASIWLDTLPKIGKLAFPAVKLKPHERDGYMSLPNDSEIWVGGLDDKERVEKILGNEYSTIYLNECSQIGYDARNLALTRLAQNIPGLRQKAYYDLNPGGIGHWSYQQFIAGLIPGTRMPLPDPGNYRHMVMNPRDNMANLTEDYVRDLANLPEKQRKRFLDGVYNSEVPGALWTLKSIADYRLPDMRAVRWDLIVRIVVAIDPAVSANEDSDETGIVVAGLTRSGHVVVLEDQSGIYTPLEWAQVAIGAYRKHQADKIVAEVNNGGDLVGRNILAVDAYVSFKSVRATRGKALRAEPIANLYAQGLVHHVGYLSELEEQMLGWSPVEVGAKSPDRLDALVWAITELIDPGPTDTRVQVGGWETISSI
jgi:phage terminase large subunit-like protein